MSKKLEVTASRRVALELLQAVLNRRKNFEDALAINEAFRKLPDRDKRFARLVSATTLRRLGQIDEVIGKFIEKPLPKSAQSVKDIMRLAIAEMLFLGVAPHASVDSAVTLAETNNLVKFKGLTNSVLRRTSREGAAILATVSETQNIPEWMLNGWIQNYGKEEADRITSASLMEPPLDISVKKDPEGWAKRLNAKLLQTGTLRRTFEGPIGSMVGFDEGAWWVQDAAAAMPVRLLGDVNGLRVLDLCAAPGGKTAQLCSAGAKVTAVDRSEIRLKRLQRNLNRLGLSAEIILADGTEWRPTELFDAILLDPPCSSTGTIRRHPDILHSKKSHDLEILTKLQHRLLKNSLEMIKSGGRIIFCTCSLQPEEGEHFIENFFSKTKGIKREQIQLKEVGNMSEIVTTSGDLRTLPHHMFARGGLDGFYACRLIRT